MTEQMTPEELKENLDVFEDDEFQELFGGAGSIVPLEDIPNDQLID